MDLEQYSLSVAIPLSDVVSIYPLDVQSILRVAHLGDIRDNLSLSVMLYHYSRILFGDSGY